jgi:hypothetical protein
MTAYPDYAIVTDHTAQALGLLIDQYQGLPRFSGLVSSYVNRVQELEDVQWDVINKRLLDYTALDGSPANAVSAQLDTIGKLVGCGRNGNDDATYLVFIRAQIFLNKSTARRDQIIQLLELVEPQGFTYDEFYPCTVLIQYLGDTAASPLVLLELAQKCVSGGVQLFLVVPPTISAVSTFAFSNNGSASDFTRGFGTVGSSAYGAQLSSEYT